MKPVALLLLILFTTACTKKNNKSCDIPGEVREKLINESVKNCTCLPRLDMRTYQSKNIYSLYYLGPNCSTFSTLYDEKGDLLASSFEPLFATIMENSTQECNVWSCGDAK